MRARPTVYNGIQMRSRLEARVAAWLDSLGARWVYEPVAFGSQSGQYLPDFRLLSDLDSTRLARPVYMEVKGRLEYEDSLALMRMMVSAIEPSEPRAALIIATEQDLETGFAYTHYCSTIQGWRMERMVPFLIEAGVIEAPESWAMPQWNG